MSNASLHSDSNSLDEPNSLHERVARYVRNTIPAARTAGRAAGFWSAVTIPLVYLPLLAAGLDTTQDVSLFLSLLLLNLVGLVVGRNHAR